MGMKLNGARQLLAYADDVNLLVNYINTIKKNIEVVIYARKVCLDVKIQKTKCMLMSRHQNTGQNRNIMIANKAFENVAEFRYLGTTVTKI
jgi:hypothetical protein